LEVRLREPLPASERYTFGFRYESAIRPTVSLEGVVVRGGPTARTILVVNLF
jgi:hypothetical protein